MDNSRLGFLFFVLGRTVVMQQEGQGFEPNQTYDRLIDLSKIALRYEFMRAWWFVLCFSVLPWDGLATSPGGILPDECWK